VPKLTSRAYVREILERHGLQPYKKLGQNFLVDENILQKITAAADLQAGDHVLEVGPGIGALTEKLAQKAGYVTALEIDSRLLPLLQETLGRYENITVLHQDALHADYGRLCSKGPLKLVANLPYNIATPLLYRLLKEEWRQCFKLLVCMVQKEVAERITAVPGGKDYGVLSVVCQYNARAEIIFTVSGNVFYPRPEVTSAVVGLYPYQETLLQRDEEKLFYRVVEGVFAQRRKTTLNALQAALQVSKEELAALGRETGIDLQRRGETMNIDEFATLARFLYNRR
jgi:16S rRNA (adenine1518-N6/adenine1519-N6)-dimethyltransferase